MDNKSKHDIILNYLRAIKYKPYDIQYLSSYFIINFPKDAICHFKIKEFKNWKFGIWIQEDGNKKEIIAFFGQYEPFIDKFKPSASYVECEVNLKYTTNLSQIKYYLDFLKRHKFISIHNEYFCNMNDSFSRGELQCALWFFGHRIAEIANQIKEWFCVKYELCKLYSTLMFFKYITRHILDYVIIDKNKGNDTIFTHYPQYVLHIAFGLETKERKKNFIRDYFTKNRFENVTLPQYWGEVDEEN